jgi:hypothetical protein
MTKEQTLTARRSLLLGGSLAVIGGLARLRYLGYGVAEPPSSGKPLAWYTPNERFFVTAGKPLPAPIDPSSTHLRVRSEGAQHSLPWPQLRALAAQQVDRTLICDGTGFEIRTIHAAKNTFEHWDWQFGAIGNASWDVIPLDRLFDTLKLPLLGPYVRAVATDGQDWLYPIETVRRGEILVAVGMNGSPLSHSHGAPARLIASGQYGRASLKWIVELTAGVEAYSSRAYEGGPSHVTQVKPIAFAATPAKDSKVGSRVRLSGAAYAGAIPIQEVIITNEARKERTRARLVDPAQPFIWTRWEAEVELARGAQILTVACADQLGRHSRQRSPRIPKEPDGWDGLHRLRLVSS